MPFRGKVLALGAVIALLGAGCGGSQEKKGAEHPGAAPAAATPSARTRPPCIEDDPKAKDSWAGDTEIIILGGGAKGVVLAPQIDGDVCGFMDEGKRLAGKGYHVAAFSWGKDQRASLPAAAKALYADGAKRIVVMGASAGGGMALNQAAGLTPPAVGAIGVSPVDTWGGEPGLRAFRGPLLMVSSRDDAQPNIKAFTQAHPGKEDVRIFAGSSHGTSLLTVEDKASEAVDRFLAAHL